MLRIDAVAAFRQGSGLRAVLLKHRDLSFGPKSRWHIPGGVDEITAALQAGRAVIVSSRLLWSALAAAGRSGRLVILPPEVSSPVVTG